MIHIKRIVVPIDFSDPSKKALRYALELARTYNAEIVLLHVLEIPVAYPIELPAMPLYSLQVMQEIRKSAEAHIAKLRDQEIPKDIASSTIVCEGRPASAICRTAHERAADLIVIATHGYTMLKHALLGSTAERVVQRAPCPVLIVREVERDFMSDEAAARSDKACAPEHA